MGVSVQALNIYYIPESSVLPLFISKHMCTADTVKSHEKGIACGFTNNVGHFYFSLS